LEIFHTIKNVLYSFNRSIEQFIGGNSYVKRRQHTDQPAAGGQPRLLSEFPYPTYEEWYGEAVKLLKGAPFEKKMYTKTYEGITLQPIYTQKDVEGRPHIESLPGFAPYLRGNTAGGYQEPSWQIAQEISCATPEEVNAALQNDLKTGKPPSISCSTARLSKV
jgi:methylmalonyl-CoA mutase